MMVLNYIIALPATMVPIPKEEAAKFDNLRTAVESALHNRMDVGVYEAFENDMEILFKSI